MSWASRKQFKYLSFLLVLFLIVIFWFFYPMIFKNPTCFDGKKNGDEVGIDCGGSCSRLCPSQVSSPVVVWSRPFLISKNIYNLGAYLENKNINGAVAEANYEFRIYDFDNKLIGVREGTTFIPPNQKFLIFEPRFNSGENRVKSISFEILPPLVWYKKEPVINFLPIKIDNINLDNSFNLPSLTARIKNDSIYDLPSFELVAIIYDDENNAINISKTKKDGLVSGESQAVSFSWPEALSGLPVKNDILIQINPFNIFF